MSNEYLTVSEAAEVLKVHTRTIRRWIKAGKLKARSIPGRGSSGVEYRIAEEDLHAFLGGNQEADHD